MRAAKIVSSVQLISSPMVRRGYAGVALAAASWGTWGIILRLAGEAQPIAPALCSFVVMSTIGVVLGPLALRATRRRAQARSARQWALVGAFGVSDALNCVLFFAALATTSAAVAVLTHYLAPLLVALGAPLALGERRRPGTVVAALLGLCGLTLLLAPWQVQSEGGLVEGALLGLGSAFFYAASLLFNKRLSRSFEASELLVYHMPSALVLVALLVPQGGWVLSTPGLLWLLFGALGPGALAGIIFMRSLAQVPAEHASVLTFVEPLTALAIAAFAWGESLEMIRLAGGAAILTAGYLVVRKARPSQLEGAVALPPTG
jgi:drug/metabolite transporter (DMT)-like permease